MKVLLVRPSFGSAYGLFRGLEPSYPPLGLLSIASVLLQAGHTVSVLDMAVADTDMETLVKRVRDDAFDAVGITALTCQAAEAYFITENLRNYTNVKIIAGGPHASALPDEFLSKGAHSVVIGEGEKLIFDALEAEGKFGPDEPESLDGLPEPARGLVNLLSYRYFLSRRAFTTNIITSRGCAGSCLFCSVARKARWRGLSPARVEKEILSLAGEFNIGEFHISDDAFFTDRDRAFEILERLSFLARTRGLIFAAQNGFRVDELDEQTLVMLKRAGFYMISFGLESGLDETLRRAGKGFTVRDAARVVKMAAETGFETWGFFILGFPGEKRESIEATVDFALSLPLDIAKFTVFCPYPGTEMYSRLKKKGQLRSVGWDEYRLYSPPVFESELRPEEVYEALKAAYRKFYLRPSKIPKFALYSMRSGNRLIDVLRAFPVFFRK